MKQHIFLFFVCALCAFAHGVEAEGIVATVGTQNILRSDVRDELLRAGLENDQFHQMLTHLMERKLIIKAAEEAKMTIQEWVLENRVREIIDARFKGDRNELVKFLATQKMSYPEWHKRVKDDLIVNAMRWNMVDKNVSASPAEMREEFKKNAAAYRTVESASVSILTVKPGEPKLNSFEEGNVKTYVAVNPKEIFHPLVQEKILTLKKGECSDWIEIDGWNFMIRQDEDVVAKSRTFAEAYDDIEATVRMKNAEKLYRAWIERLQEETYIKIY